MESTIQVHRTFFSVSLELMMISQNKCADLLDRLEVKSAIDTLHSVVTEAQARAKSGDIGPDVWYDTLEPWGATRARTLPVLQTEVDRLKAQRDQV